jgi:hypothetical protein
MLWSYEDPRLLGDGGYGESFANPHTFAHSVAKLQWHIFVASRRVAVEKDGCVRTFIDIIRVPLCVAWMSVSLSKPRTLLLNYVRITKVGPGRPSLPLSKYFSYSVTLWEGTKDRSSFSLARQEFITDSSCGNKMPTRCNRWIFIADLTVCSTCFGHLYAHHQEL